MNIHLIQSYSPSPGEAVSDPLKMIDEEQGDCPVLRF